MKDGLERRPLLAGALLAAALSALGPGVALAGRLAWLGPVLALPAGLLLCLIWGRLGEKDLSAGLEGAFGPRLGRAAEFLYLLWGLFLLASSARRYADRLLDTASGENARWLFLGAALALCLWLGRGEGRALARAGRLFFLAAAGALALAVLLALPGVDWRNLWPAERWDGRGLPAAALFCLSLSGYGVYALCLPGPEERGRAWPWAVWGCGGLSALLLVTVGVFGPGLAARMDEPFLLLLEGAGAPAALRRGEAGLTAVTALAEVTLLALLARGCGVLWRHAAPCCRGRGIWLPVGAAFWAAGMLPGQAWVALLTEKIAPAGNLIFAVLLPALAVLTRKVRGEKGERGISCGENSA